MSALPPPQDEESYLYKFARGLYNTGELLLYDDKDDIGYFAYKNRPHYYHGELKKDHPSVWHHWPIGMGFMFTGQLLGVLATIYEMKQAMEAERQETFNTDVQ